MTSTWARPTCTAPPTWTSRSPPLKGSSRPARATSTPTSPTRPPPPAVQLLKGDIEIREGTLEIDTFRSKTPLGDPTNRLILNGGSFLLTTASTADLVHRLHVGPAGGTLRTSSPSQTVVSSPVSGSGQLLLSEGYGRVTFTADNSLSGPLVQNAGMLTLAGAGAFRSIPSLTLHTTMGLDYAAVPADRLSDTAPILLSHQASISMTAAATVPVHERIGVIQLSGGYAQIEPPASKSTNAFTLTAERIDRSARGILHVPTWLGQTSGTNASRMFLSTAPPMVGAGATGTASVPIVPGVLAYHPDRGLGAFELVTYSSAGGLRPLVSTEHVGFFPTSGSPQNVRLNSDEYLRAPATINSLKLSFVGGGITDLSGTNTLRINSGVVLAVGRWAIEPPLDFAGREAILATRESDLDISSVISNANGLTLSGHFKLSGASTFTGPVNLAGDLELRTSVHKNTPGPLGASADPLIISSGTLLLVNSPTFARDIEVRTSPQRGAGVRGSGTISGNISGTGTFGFGALSGTFDVPGRIAGDLRISVASGTVRLRGANTFTGRITVGSGAVLSPASPAALSTGPLRFIGGNAGPDYTTTLRADTAPLRIPNAVTIQSGLHVGGQHPVDFAGDVATEFGASLVLSNDVPVTFSGRLTAGGIGFWSDQRLTLAGDLRVPSIASARAGTIVIASHAPALRDVRLSKSVRLELSPGRDKILDLTHLELLDASAIDLADNALVLRDQYGHALDTLIRSGRNGGAWDGTGLRSSAAAAEPGRYAIGYARAADVLDFSSGPNALFMGIPVPPDAALARTTLLGDADLDGIVNFSDLVRLAQNYDKTDPDLPWSAGDFTFDSRVDFADLVLLAQNYNALAPQPIPGAPAGFAAEISRAMRLVPDPAGLASAALLAGLASTRRRHRSATRRRPAPPFP